MTGRRRRSSQRVSNVIPQGEHNFRPLIDTQVSKADKRENMANPILVTGAAGRVGGVGRTVTEMLLKQGKDVRAMVRNEDERAQVLRDMGAEVVVGNLLDLDSMHRAIAGCETMYFGMSVSDAYLAATVNVAAVAKHHGVKAFINMSQMTLSQMSITETTASPQQRADEVARGLIESGFFDGRVR
jgi:nucleoside-diphosphate-sugar epimerase